jgi:hypothetical protein
MGAGAERVLGNDGLAGGHAGQRLLGAPRVRTLVLPEPEQQRESREVEQRGQLAEGRGAQHVDVDVGRQQRRDEHHVLVAEVGCGALHPLEHVHVAEHQPRDAREVGEAQERREPAHAFDRQQVRRVAVLAQASALEARR